MFLLTITLLLYLLKGYAKLMHVLNFFCGYFQVSLFEDSIPDFWRRNHECFTNEHNLEVLKAMENFQVEIIKFENMLVCFLKVLSSDAYVHHQLKFHLGPSAESEELAAAAAQAHSPPPEDQPAAAEVADQSVAAAAPTSEMVVPAAESALCLGCGHELVKRACLCVPCCSSPSGRSRCEFCDGPTFDPVKKIQGTHHWMSICRVSWSQFPVLELILS